MNALHHTLRIQSLLALEQWQHNELFTWTWWFLLGMFVIPWLIFLKFVNRKRSLTIWLYGLVVIILTTFLDDLGADTDLWAYPVKLIPYTLIEMPFDFSIIPVTQMLLYQYFDSWKRFLIAISFQAFIFAFIGEPFSVWARAVTYYHWNYFDSFLFYIFAGIFSKAFVAYWSRAAGIESDKKTNP